MLNQEVQRPGSLFQIVEFCPLLIPCGLLGLDAICVISFLLATGISFFLAKGFQQELLLHDYGVSGYQLNHTEKC